jgi:CheY-like chemotaxis protein
VLLVEDEDPVRKVVQRTLDAAGYEVLTAASADDALAILRRHPADVDVLLTDVLMPGMDGATLAQIVSAERPHTRVLFMSGHPKDAFTQVGMDPQSVRMLRKPFSAAALCRELRDVLS